MRKAPIYVGTGKDCEINKKEEQTKKRTLLRSSYFKARIFIMIIYIMYVSSRYLKKRDAIQ